MYTIEFNKKHNFLDDTLLGMVVEKTLREDGILLRSFKENGSLNEIRRGIFGMDSELYELKNMGAILYQKINTLNGYIAKVFLIGFDERSNVFKKLKGKLEELLIIDDIEVIKEKFLAKNHNSVE